VVRKVNGAIFVGFTVCNKLYSSAYVSWCGMALTATYIHFIYDNVHEIKYSIIASWKYRRFSCINIFSSNQTTCINSWIYKCPKRVPGHRRCPLFGKIWKNVKEKFLKACVSNFNLCGTPYAACVVLRPCRNSAVNAGFPLRWPGFAYGQHVGFVVDKAALGQVFSEYFSFPCQSFHRFLHYRNQPRLTQ
jgi:hypothetical protein